MRITTGTTVFPRTPGLAANGGDRDWNVFEREFDPAAEDASYVVVEAVAFIHNVDAVELDPLATVVDPEALDALLASVDSDDAGAVEVTFTYEGLEITVADDGRLLLRWRN